MELDLDYSYGGYVAQSEIHEPYFMDFIRRDIEEFDAKHHGFAMSESPGRGSELHGFAAVTPWSSTVLLNFREKK